MALVDDVAGNESVLLLRGAARFRGYVLKITKATVKDVNNPTMQKDLVSPICRIYTSSSFDRWVDVALSDVLHDTGPRPEDEGRSLVWVHGDAVVRQCRAAPAADIAAVLDVGGDPGGWPPGGGP